MAPPKAMQRDAAATNISATAKYRERLMTRRESATRTATATRSASGSIATIGSREPGGQRLSRPTNNRPVVAARPVPKAPAAAPAEPKQRRKTHFQWSTTSAMTTPACTTLPASQAGTPSPTPAEAASSPVKRPVSPAPTITSMGSSGVSISSVSSAASDPSLAMRDQVVVAPCALPIEPLPGWRIKAEPGSAASSTAARSTRPQISLAGASGPDCGSTRRACYQVATCVH